MLGSQLLVRVYDYGPPLVFWFTYVSFSDASHKRRKNANNKPDERADAVQKKQKASPSDQKEEDSEEDLSEEEKEEEADKAASVQAKKPKSDRCKECRGMNQLLECRKCGHFYHRICGTSLKKAPKDCSIVCYLCSGRKTQTPLEKFKTTVAKAAQELLEFDEADSCILVKKVVSIIDLTDED
jgi:hypothetical protein